MRMRTMKLSRQGAMAPFAAVLAAVLVGMVAFAVDIGWIVLTKSQLQNAADASALAGVDPLMDGYIQYHMVSTEQAKQDILTKYLNQARAMAKKYAGYNNAGEVSGLSLRDEDIEFGFMDADGNYSTTYTAFPNTIKVLLRRDSEANGSLGLFFAPVIGTTSADLTASARATVMAGRIQDLSSEVPWNLGILPMTYDGAHWENFLQTGRNPDGVTSVDANGVPQLKVYASLFYKGNFGGLSMNNNDVGNSDMVDWVKYGLKKEDILALQASGLIPFSSHDPNTWDWHGISGFHSAMVEAVNDFVGDVYLLPVFKAKEAGSALPAGSKLNRKLPWNGPAYQNVKGPRFMFDKIQLVSARSDWATLIVPAAGRLAQFQADDTKRKGNLTGKTSDANSNLTVPLGSDSSLDSYQAGEGQGTNYYYNITGFVGVKIMPSNALVINSEIILQPAAYVDSFAVFESSGDGKLQPAGTHTELITTFSPPKLTQ